MFERFFANLFGDIILQNPVVKQILKEAVSILKPFETKIKEHINTDI